MPEETAAPSAKPAPTLQDEIERLIPAPGLYLVGEFRGIEQIEAGGKKHNFVKLVTSDSMVKAYLQADDLLEYVKKEEGDTILLPVRVNVRKNKLTGTLQDEIQYGVQRTKK